MASRTIPANITISLHNDATQRSRVAALNPHKLEIYADGAVWDTVSNKFLIVGKDFEFGDLGRT